MGKYLKKSEDSSMHISIIFDDPSLFLITTIHNIGFFFLNTGLLITLNGWVHSIENKTSSML